LAQPLHKGWAVVDRTGAQLISVAAWVSEVSLIGVRALIEAFRPPYEFRENARQKFEIGWRSTPLVATAGLAISVVLSMHTRASLERFGAEAMIPAGLAMALIRETGPLVTALLVSGRVGAGIGAELGAMKVTEQIDALEAVAVDSFKYRAGSRIVAWIVAVPLLTPVAHICGTVGRRRREAAVNGTSP